MAVLLRHGSTDDAANFVVVGAGEEGARGRIARQLAVRDVGHKRRRRRVRQVEDDDAAVALEADERVGAPLTSPTTTDSGSMPLSSLRLSREFAVLVVLNTVSVPSNCSDSRSNISPLSHTRRPCVSRIDTERPPNVSMRSKSPSPSMSPLAVDTFSRPSAAVGLERGRVREGDRDRARSRHCRGAGPRRSRVYSRASPSLAMMRNVRSLFSERVNGVRLVEAEDRPVRDLDAALIARVERVAGPRVILEAEADDLLDRARRRC